MAMTYEEFGALIGVSRQRVEQLVRSGRLTPPLTAEQAAAHRRGTAGPDATMRRAVLEATGPTWERGSSIAAKVGLAYKNVMQSLAFLAQRGDVERRQVICPQNKQTMYEWRRGP
jgi:CHASE2 domain-containing sensor protein